MAFSERSKPGISVQAEQVEGDEPRSVITPNGAITAYPGDWEVRYDDGNVKKMTDEEFQKEFGAGGTSGDSAADDTVSDDGETDTNGESDEESALDNGTSSDKESAGDSPGKKAETEDATRRPSPPPPTRRR